MLTRDADGGENSPNKCDTECGVAAHPRKLDDVNMVMAIFAQENLIMPSAAMCLS